MSNHSQHVFVIFENILKTYVFIITNFVEMLLNLGYINLKDLKI